jgi:hypothetical protein
MAKNPWLSLWQGAANAWAGAARGVWMAEMHRQQKAVLNEMVRPTARPSKKSRSAQRASTGARKKSGG